MPSPRLAEAGLPSPVEVAPAGDPAAMWDAATALGLEGVVSKRLGGPYRAGRSASWVRTKK